MCSLVKMEHAGKDKKACQVTEPVQKHKKNEYFRNADLDSFATEPERSLNLPGSE